MSLKSKKKIQKLLKDMNKKISQYCKKCDEICCSTTKLHIIFYRHEIKPFVQEGLKVYKMNEIKSKTVIDYIKWHSDDILNSQWGLIKQQSLIQINHSKYLLYSPISHKCIFYNSNKKQCDIWEDRPMVCRIYPLNFGENDNETVWLDVMWSCKFDKEITQDLKEYLKNKKGFVMI